MTNSKISHKYTIDAHGAIIVDDKDNYYGFKIPHDNITLNTFTEFSERLLCVPSIRDTNCISEHKMRYPIFSANSYKFDKLSKYKYKGNDFIDKNILFPNILLLPDDTAMKKSFYSQVSRCDDNRIIHSMDIIPGDNPAEPCIFENNINLINSHYPYRHNLVEGDFTCGPIFLEDVINKIYKFHNENYKDSECEIYLLFCLDKYTIENFCTKYEEEKQVVEDLIERDKKNVSLKINKRAIENILDFITEFKTKIIYESSLKNLIENQKRKNYDNTYRIEYKWKVFIVNFNNTITQEDIYFPPDSIKFLILKHLRKLDKEDKFYDLKYINYYIDFKIILLKIW